MYRPRRLIVSWAFFAAFLCAAENSFAAMYINLVAVNPSSTQSRQLPITYYFPKELKPDDVQDAAGLDVDYDIDQACYFVHGVITMLPKESRVIKIQVRDVWYITQQEVDVLRKQMGENLDRVQGTPYDEASMGLHDKLIGQLDYVLAQQENFSGNVERRIEEYRAHVELLNEIRNTTFSIEHWEDQHVKVPEIIEKTVTFIIEVENPKNEAKAYKQQHYLPAEVKSEHIVNKEGFEVRFDEAKQQSYLFKEEEFLPNEKERYEIEIIDIWRVTQDKLDNLRERSQTAYKGVEKSKYAESAKYLFDSVIANLDKIETSQSQKQNMKEHIGAFRTNKVVYQATEEDVLRLEKILALVKAKKLEEMEKTRVKNVLRKIRELQGIQKISETVFGKDISIEKMWRMIWATLVFVGVFTAIHFFTWLKRSRDARRRQQAQSTEEKMQSA